jgi:hypothetical protein
MHVLCHLPPKPTKGPRYLSAWCIIEARRRNRPNRSHDDDDNDRFPAFTSNITEKSYPKEFKPVGILKYDSKQDPR